MLVGTSRVEGKVSGAGWTIFRHVCLSNMTVPPQAPGSSPAAAPGEMAAAEEMAERLAQTELLVAQLKEMIREKDAALCSKDEQMKVRSRF